MEIKTVSSRLTSLVVLYDMQTDFFSFVLEGISDSDAHNRLNTKANHIAWLTGSLVQQRYEMAKYFKADPATYKDTATAHELFSDNKGIQGNVTYPSLEAYRNDWKLITPVLRDVLMTATDSQLDEDINMPGMKMSLYDLTAFMIYREANCIGQIALWRRLLGYPAMRYM
jgi:hypothetical protein